MFDFNGDGNVSHKESATGFLLLAASVIIIAISASTTFGFFSTYFPAIVSPEFVGPMYAKVISGMIGVTVFDLMTVTFLLAFLYKAETPEQRAISLIMTFVTFIFSAIASAAHLYMTASGNMAQDGATLSTLRNVAMVSVVLGVVINFGAWISYTRYSYSSKVRVREADRRDMVQRAEDAQANHLDKLVAQKVQEELEQMADSLAMVQARRIADAFSRREHAKYHNAPTPQLPAPAVASQTQQAHPQPTPPQPEARPSAPTRPFGLEDSTPRPLSASQPGDWTNPAGEWYRPG